MVLALSVIGPRSPGAHETIDADGVNAILAATDTAAARVKSVAGSVAEGEAMFALGMVEAEATAVACAGMIDRENGYSHAGDNKPAG